MKPKLKICVVTGTRAEYGLLYYLIKEIGMDSDLELQIIATGAHLSPEFGLTYKQIEADGFKIDGKVEMLLSSDTSVGITKSLGLGVIGFADEFNRLKPDILVLLGDRYEILASAQAAMIAKITIAHIHGGETTEGCFDESIRHSITKMAQYHFVAAEPYRKRVIQLGEDPNHVFNFGAPGLDCLQHLKWLDRNSLEKSLSLPLKSPLFLVTHHPSTLSQQEPIKAMDELLKALDEFSTATIIFTYPNADTNGRALIERMKEWSTKNLNRSKICVSLGQQRYLSLMREADVIIGNSSSGLTEAPALKKATVNIGDRQKGRLKSSSVIDALEEKQSIVNAVNKALSDKFYKGLASTISLYGAGNVSVKIKDTLKTIQLQTQKSFFDIRHDF